MNIILYNIYLEPTKTFCTFESPKTTKAMIALLGFLKSQFIEIIEWPEDDRQTLLWKFPDEDREIKMGAQLIVRPSQAAIFVNEGVVADVYGPGRYELVTRNMPVLSRLRGWKYGFNSPFKVDVYFVSTRKFRNLKWGTRQPIPVSDPEFSMVPLRAFGTFGVQIEDPATFFKEFAGADPHVTTEELIEEFRSRLVTQFSRALKVSGKTLQEININAHALGDALLPILQKDFKEIGLNLFEFNVESVTLPEEIQRQLVQQDLEARGIRRKGFAKNEVEIQNFMARANLSQNIQDMQKFLQFQFGTNLGKGGGSGDEHYHPSSMQYMVEMAMGMDFAKQILHQQKPQEKTDKKKTRESIIKAIKELAQLKEQGVITEEEFNQTKKELLEELKEID